MPVKYDVVVFIKNNVPLRKSSFQGFSFWFFFEFVPQNLRSNRSLVHPFASILLGDFLFVYKNSHTGAFSFWFSFVAEL